MTLVNKHASVPDMASLPDTGLAARDGRLRREKYLRKVLVFLGVLVLAYVYSSNLFAQQSAGQRISVSQAVDFPNDI